MIVEINHDAKVRKIQMIPLTKLEIWRFLFFLESIFIDNNISYISWTSAVVKIGILYDKIFDLNWLIYITELPRSDLIVALIEFFLFY